MAVGDVGMFLPAEAHYKRPGAYDAMLKAEALKRAAWLSSMDQFYENLGEAQRQFDLTLAFKEETRDIELEWAREKFGTEVGLERERLGWEREYGTRALGLKARELGIAERGAATAEDISELMEQKGEQDIDYLRELLGKGPSGPQFGGGLSAPVTATGTPARYEWVEGRQQLVGAPRGGEVTPPTGVTPPRQWWNSDLFKFETGERAGGAGLTERQRRLGI